MDSQRVHQGRSHQPSGQLVPKTCEWCCVLNTYWAKPLAITPRKVLKDVALCDVCREIVDWYAGWPEEVVLRRIRKRMEEKEYQ